MCDSKNNQTNLVNDENYLSDFELNINSEYYKCSRKFLAETMKYAVLYGVDRALMTKKLSNRSKGFNQLSSSIHSHSVDDGEHPEACKASEKLTYPRYCLHKEDASKVVKFIPSRGNFSFPLNLVIFIAVLMLKLISIQFSFFTRIFTTPIWLSYYLIMLPFQTLMGMKKLFIRRLSRMCIELLSRSTSYIYARILGNKSIIYLGLNFTRALFWSIGACFLLVGLLCSALFMGGITTKRLVEQPIQIAETLNFDYTKDSPVALLPVKLYNHNLQLTVALTLPESEYNMKLGMFQVRVELLSAKGKVTASSSHPCMLKFKSPSIRFIETIYKAAPLIAGFQTESQILKIKIRNLAKRYEPTGYLKVALVQRAEHNTGAGIPQIHDASLTIESELSKLKSILWFWRRIILVLISMMAFWTELVLLLVFFGCYIMPRGKVKA